MGCSKFYSLGTTGGMNKKSGLRKDLAAWRGKDFSKEELAGFELKNILGKGCQVVVEHNEEGRSRVTGVFGLPKGTQVPPPTNPQVEYSIADGKNEVFNALPDFLKSMCLACLEWNGGVERPVKSSEPEFPPDDPNGDSVPF
jgi:hypothetical protein